MLRLNPRHAEHSIRVPEGIVHFDEHKALLIHTHNLPHLRQEDTTYFVTFRQIDSIPAEVWEQIKREASAWNERLAAAIQQRGSLPSDLAAQWQALQHGHFIEA